MLAVVVGGIGQGNICSWQMFLGNKMHCWLADVNVILIDGGNCVVVTVSFQCDF